MNERTQRIVRIVIMVLTGLLMVSSGVMKLMPNAAMIDSYARWGVSIEFMYFIGIAELLGGIGIFIPKLRKFAISGLMIIMWGAVFSHIKADEYQALTSPIMVIVMLVLIWVLSAKTKSAPSEDLNV
ncbi:MAG: hypothetical protein RL226_851 [Bacteroidota bacterium]